MKFVVNNITRVVTMSCDNMTIADIVLDSNNWCDDYNYPIDVYDTTGPAGFIPNAWTLTSAGHWDMIPGKITDINNQALIDSITPTIDPTNIAFTSILVEGVTQTSVVLHWTKVNTATLYEVKYVDDTGNSLMIVVPDSGSEETSVEINGLKISTLYSFYVRALTQWGTSPWSNPVSKNTGDSLIGPGDILKKINPDIQPDKLQQYLAGEISLAVLMETVNAAFEAGSVQDKTIGYLPDVVYSFGRDIVMQAGTIGEHSAIFELLKDSVTLQLTNHGHVMGMTMGWDDTKDTSEIVFLSDVFKVSLPDGSGVKTAFSIGTVNGSTEVGIHGNLVIDGSLTARTIASNQLYIGTAPDGTPGKIQMGEGAFITWGNIVNPPAMPDLTDVMYKATFINQDGIWTHGVYCDQLVGTIITGKTLQTKSDPLIGDRSRFIVNSSNNQAEFYDTSNNLVLQLGTAAVNDPTFLGWASIISNVTGTRTTNSYVTDRIDAGYFYSNIGNGLYGYSTYADYSGSAYAQLGIGLVGMGPIGVSGVTLPGSGSALLPAYGGVFKASGWKGGEPISWHDPSYGGPIRIVPAIASTPPTHPSGIGTLWVTSGGDIYIYKTAGWLQIG